LVHHPSLSPYGSLATGLAFKTTVIFREEPLESENTASFLGASIVLWYCFPLDIRIPIEREESMRLAP
jgi:hypothetical protein